MTMRPARARPWRARRPCLALAAAAASLLSVASDWRAAFDVAVLGAQSSLAAPFVVASTGCAMAHCDGRMSDLVRTIPPGPSAATLWQDIVLGPSGETMGSQRGLGCASNGSIAACTFGTPVSEPCSPFVRDTLIVYDYGGNAGLPSRRWSSGSALACTAWTSAPMVSASNEVIAADVGSVIRFDANGAIVWQTPTPGGHPISPVMTENGVVVLGTFRGPLSAYHNQTGQFLGALQLSDGAGGDYDTINTPAVRGNRVYVVAQHRVATGFGRLVAVDVIVPPGYDPADPVSLDPTFPVLRPAWHFDIGAPSGASPLVMGDTVYFDADTLSPGSPFEPHIFAVRDLGASPALVWKRAMLGRVVASFAQDPRGGLWAYTASSPAVPDNRFLYRFSPLDADSDGIGNIVERIDVDALVGEPGMHRPRSAISVAGPAAAPVLLVSVAAQQPGGSQFSSYVLAIDVLTRALQWRVPLPDVSPSQFPLLLGPSGPRVIFTVDHNGTWVVGEP